MPSTMPDTDTALKTDAINSEVPLPAASDSKALTMKEVIAIAYIDAKKWSDGAELIMITSTDSTDNPSIKSGEAGKRNAWNLTFKDTNSTHEFSILVSNGEVVFSRECEYGDKTTIKNSDLTLDSSDALLIAINQKKLQPGQDWAVGYHFVLYCAPNYNAPDYDESEYLIIQVVGLSPRGNFARVTIDEKTGQIIGASEKTYDDKGNAIWTDF